MEESFTEIKGIRDEKVLYKYNQKGLVKDMLNFWF